VQLRSRIIKGFKEALQLCAENESQADSLGEMLHVNIQRFGREAARLNNVMLG
jgi:hypothetical protein